MKAEKAAKLKETFKRAGVVHSSSSPSKEEALAFIKGRATRLVPHRYIHPNTAKAILEAFERDEEVSVALLTLDVLSPSALAQILDECPHLLHPRGLVRLARESANPWIISDLVKKWDEGKLPGWDGFREEFLIAFAQNQTWEAPRHLAAIKNLPEEAVALLLERPAFDTETLSQLGRNPTLGPKWRRVLVERKVEAGRATLEDLIEHPDLLPTFFEKATLEALVGFLTDQRTYDLFEKEVRGFLDSVSENPNWEFLVWVAKGVKNPRLAEELFRRFGNERVRKSLALNPHLPPSLRSGFVEGESLTLGDLLDLLPQNPTLAPRIEEILLSQGIPPETGEELIRKLVRHLPLLPPNAQDLLLSEAPVKKLVGPISEAIKRFSPEMVAKVISHLGHPARTKEKKLRGRFVDALASRGLQDFSDELFGEVLKVLTRGRKEEEVLRVVYVLARAASQSLPLLKKLLEFAPEGYRGVLLNLAGENPAIPNEVVEFLLERGALPRKALQKSEIPLSKDLQLEALRRGHAFALAQRKDLHPEVVVEAMKEAIAADNLALLKSLLEGQAVPPEGVRLLLASSKTDLLLRGVQLGVYYRDVPPLELAQAIVKLVERGVRVGPLLEEAKARLEREGFALEAVGL